MLSILTSEHGKVHAHIFSVHICKLYLYQICGLLHLWVIRKIKNCVLLNFVGIHICCNSKLIDTQNLWALKSVGSQNEWAVKIFCGYSNLSALKCVGTQNVLILKYAGTIICGYSQFVGTESL